MAAWQKIFLLVLLASLFLFACGSDSPVLGVAGKPAVVFVYTDG